MIQRKQTVFLLLALAAVVACLMMPVGFYEPLAMGGNLYVTCFSTRGLAEPSFNYGLFATLLLACPVTLWAVFAFKNRKFQARLCTVNMLLMVAWYAFYALKAFVDVVPETSFKPLFASCLPFVALILYVLARKGIIADEKLVRAADRIR